MNLSIWLMRTAQVAPQRPALFAGPRAVLDYGGFHAAAASVAAALQGRGIGSGDRVALFAKNVPEYLIAQYGAWYAGAAVVPVNAKLHPREAAWILRDSGAKLAFATPALAEALARAGVDCPVEDLAGEGFASMRSGSGVAAPAPRAPGDLAWLFYTSGTTGKPKGVIITHRMLMAMSLSYFADVDEVRAEDAALYAAPLSHAAGIYNMMHVLKGARHVFPLSGGFDPAEILDLAARLDSVHLFAAPTMVQRLTREARAAGRRGEGLRTVVYAGGPMYNADIIEAVAWFGPRFVQIYGQGECPMAITALSRQDVAERAHPRWRERLGSVGRAQSAVEVAISDGAGGFAPPGQAGEVMVRGDPVMPGYWNNPEATAKTLVNGWLMTGDIGVLDEDGYLTLKDRSKDLIISGGANIYPREVEEALLAHPGVAEAAVVGRPHPEWGEEVVAFVVRAPEAAVGETELEAHCLERIARFKRPRAWFFIEELPKNNYGKVLKTALRARLGG